MYHFYGLLHALAKHPHRDQFEEAMEKEKLPMVHQTYLPSPATNPLRISEVLLRDR